MSNTGRTRALASALIVALAMIVGLVGAGVGSAAAAGDGREVVGKTAEGKMISKVVGKTSTGDRVTGSFTPIKFVKRDGKLWVKGFLDGVVTGDDGSKTLFSGIEKMRVKKINGERITSARQAQPAVCEILHLVLGPLHLDLLGLVIDLSRIELRIVATPGPGNLLGNLLCAIAGLLDPGPGGGLLGNLLTQIRDLLNQILARLNLGL
ncbi:hypothetical protein DDE18_18175 [Nocardioides gansuensis]|uniref:Uncharacterized protein n=1 Tax=Nocardioides gansuensis TaxID=2138300 RepID=A0A2T8F6S9_9ACTN|nr:hypothetical protein [Nocardioides gansuensis]PVG81415.1 hypothetical protein DDE18_18175 [Nocardioides gansuensis]